MGPKSFRTASRAGRPKVVAGKTFEITIEYNMPKEIITIAANQRPSRNILPKKSGNAKGENPNSAEKNKNNIVVSQ